MKDQGVTRSKPTASALDRAITLTKFSDTRARRKREFQLSLRELAKKLPNRCAPTKAELPLLKLARFGDRRTSAGSLRSNSNLISIDGVEGDYDGETVSLATAIERLRNAGLAALVYTSPSHRLGRPRWRVLCPTSRTLPAEEREQLVARLNGALEGILAPESFNASLTYFYGKVKGQPSSVIRLVEGRSIDVAADLDAGAIGKHLRKGQAAEVRAEADEEDDEFLAEPAIERISCALERIPPDERHVWLTVAQALHNEFSGSEEGFDVWEQWSRPSVKYDQEDQRRVWNSLGSYVGRPIKIGTLYRLAQEYGSKSADQGLRLLSTEECRLSQPRGYVVKGIIAPGDVGCIFGAPGAGKSLIGPHIGYQVALGDKAFGMRTRAGRVLYVAAEDPQGLQNRVAALALRQGDTPEFKVLVGVSDLLSTDSPDLAALSAIIEEQKPSLIIIDTLAMAFPGLEENDAKSMGQVVSVARKLATSGAAVVLIHHDTKSEGATPRGHSVFNGALDIAMLIKRDDAGIVRAKLTKNRNGTAERDIAFRIGIEALREDEDGEEITAALVEELTGLASRRTKPLPTSQREALAILQELEADGTVSNETWTSVCSTGFRVSQSEVEKLRRDAFTRARRGLSQAGLIEFYGMGFVRTAGLPDLTGELRDGRRQPCDSR